MSAIKLKVLPQFPAKLTGRAGIDVTKDSGEYLLDLDFTDFPVIGAVPAGTTYALIFDPVTGTYSRLPTSLLGGGAAPATALPLVESGAGAVGVSAKYAREDHVHPAFGGGGGGVTSIAGNTGAFTLSGGVINSVNDIRLNAGHLPAEPSNGNAAAGEIGEFASCYVSTAANNVTITIASPAVVTEAAHGRSPYTAVSYTSSGALPTGLALLTTYYIVGGASLTANTYQLATTIANAVAGIAINTSGTQSGVHTTKYPPFASGVALDMCALLLQPGDWEVSASTQYVATGNPQMTFLGQWLSTVSATFNANLLTAGYVSYNGAAQTSYNSAFPCSPTRFSLAVQTIVYLTALLNFTVGTYNAYSMMRARRR
jgi:hypothetical protein